MASSYKPFTRLELTYKLNNYPSHTPLSHQRIETAVNAAFAKWQVVSPFTFTKITSGQADIELSFGSVTNSQAGGETNPASHTIVFDDKRTWLDLADELRAKNYATGMAGGAGPLAVALVRGIWEAVDHLDANRVDVLSIAVHEIGHALGLEHNSASGSVMQPSFDYNKMTIVNGAPISQMDIAALNDANRSLFANYYATRGQTGWFKRGEGFVQVSAGLDNTVWAIDNKGLAREFLPAQSGQDGFWAARGDKMCQIAVFSAHMVLGLTKDYELKMFNPPPSPRPQDFQTWLSFAKDVRFVATGADGALWAIIGADGKTFRHRFGFGPVTRAEGPVFESDWLAVPGQFKDLAVGRDPQGKNEQVWGVTSTPLGLYQLNQTAKRWDEVKAPAGTLGKIAVGDDGTVVVLTTDGVYRYDGGSSWTRLPFPGTATTISVVSKPNMWAVGKDGTIYSAGA